MTQRELSSFLVTQIENVRYLSGFTGSAGICLLTPEEAFFFTDGRYTLQAAQEVRDLEVRTEPEPARDDLTNRLKNLETPIGFEAEHVSVAQLQRLQERTSARFVPVVGLVEDLRRIKDPEEIELIREAVRIVDEVFSEVKGILRVGVTERNAALEIDIAMRRSGADGAAFETIVASGPRSAFPHAQPTDRGLERGDFVTLDYGALCKCYNSDMTRTVVVGSASERQAEIYAVVQEAQARALAAIRPGVKGQEVDAVARDYISDAGYGKNFPHGLGHSLGRSVHDGPGLGRTIERVLESGMVLTVEPGIYIEGLGGVRIEDDVVVTNDGCEILTRSAKELLRV